jgi:hypothetical protein
MKGLFRVLVILLFTGSCTSAYTEPAQNRAGVLNIDGGNAVVEIANFPVANLSIQESRVRRAAVKILTQYGHGSGTYMMIRGFPIVITAAHVVGDPGTIMYKVSNGEGEVVDAIRIYFDEKIDVGVLLLGSKMKTRGYIKYKKSKSISKVGTRLVYSGYPSSHELLTIRGMVAGYGTNEGEVSVLMHGYGWFGCSGSGIFDEVGNFVGVLWGVDIEMDMVGLPQVIEDIIWVTPANRMDYDAILKGACMSSGSTRRVCKKYIE